MADAWYFGSDSKRSGPFSTAQFKELAAHGKVRAGDTVWKQGIDRGVLADRVKHLILGPGAAVLPALDSVQVDDELASSAQPPAHPSTSVSDPGAEREPTPVVANGTEPADAQAQEIIPGSLRLTAIAEEKDPEDPLAPPSTNATSLEKPAEPKPKQPSPRKPPARRKLATAMRGAVIISQDGETVRYRKKCMKCGLEDERRVTMVIRNGITSDHFFCPTCRKMGGVTIQGIAIS